MAAPLSVVMPETRNDSHDELVERYPAVPAAVSYGVAEQYDEWTEGRRYLGLDVLARSRISLAPSTSEVIPDNDLQALSA